MKKLAILTAIIIALMGMTEYHRSVYTNDCHHRGGDVTTQLYFFNQCWASFNDENPPFEMKSERIK